LIVQLFPDPKHQASAIAVFGSAGAVGNVAGVLIGAALVQYAGWSWIFWFVAIVGILIAAICLFLIPNAKRNKGLKVKFDVPGVSLLTVAVILFIFAVTSGQPKGWGSAYVLAPLVISIVITAVFFWWEARANPDDAVLPPRMWRYRNFGVLASLALFPYFWWVTSFVNLVSWWEVVYGWSAIDTAVHFLPMGIFAWAISLVTGRLPTWFAHKYIILTGLLLAVVATILLPFADSPSTYWPFIFPAFTLGTIGSMIIYANSSIAIFSYTPPHVAGTVGAVFNSALQLGSAVGLAAVSGITTSIDAKTTFEPPITRWSQQLDQITSEMWKEAFKGRASAYWFLLGILLFVTIAVVVFFKVDLPVHEEKLPVVKKDVEAVPVSVEKN
jgi:MFS family permease